MITIQFDNLCGLGLFIVNRRNHVFDEYKKKKPIYLFYNVFFFLIFIYTFKEREKREREREREGGGGRKEGQTDTYGGSGCRVF